MTLPDDSEPNFSIFQSNLLFALYFLGSGAVLGLDIMVHSMKRNRTCSGRQYTGKYILISITKHSSLSFVWVNKLFAFAFGLLQETMHRFLSGHPPLMNLFIIACISAFVG